MNKYVRKLFGIMSQSKHAQQSVRIQQQHLSTSPEEWRERWQAQGQSWRTEPEIPLERQQELGKCLAVVPDIEKGIYPFKEMKLSRAELEWLLATHENGRGPVDWSDETQRGRQGLDLRGADLRQANLQSLPLACLNGGLTEDEIRSAGLEGELERIDIAAIHLEGASLKEAHLENARLNMAYLDKVILSYAHLERAELNGTHLREADLRGANLEDADLSWSHLEDANFYKAHLERASLQGAYLDETNFFRSYLGGTNLTQASFNSRTNLRGAVLGDEKVGFVYLLDVAWNGVNLAVVKWSEVKILGDEYKARQKNRDEKEKDNKLRKYDRAVRANRQLAVELQNQGLNEDAARFAYRAQILQRKVFWKQRELGKWLFSLLLALLAGYGYRMWRILIAYLFIVLLCAAAYFVLGIYYEPHLSFLEAVLTSVTAFHGRVFSEPFLRPGEPQLWVTAFEAVMGLVIEGVFIAMLTQKFFGK